MEKKTKDILKVGTLAGLGGAGVLVARNAINNNNEFTPSKKVQNIIDNITGRTRDELNNAKLALKVKEDHDKNIREWQRNKDSSDFPVTKHNNEDFSLSKLLSKVTNSDIKID
jgi:hypothetical protein